MSRYLKTHKTNADLIRVCDEALADLQAGDSTPEVGDVVFEHATYLGWCQQHAREAVEACAYGYEGVWPDTRCCATRTCQQLRKAGYDQFTLDTAQPGDLIYWSPCGSHCSTCKQDAGHVGILHDRRNGVWRVWQNTSYHGLGMALVPLQSWQHNPVGIFRLFPLGAAETPSEAVPALVVWDGHGRPECKAWMEADGLMTVEALPLLKLLGLDGEAPALRQANVIHASGRAYVRDLKPLCAREGWILAYRKQPQGHRLYPVPNTD